MDRHGVTTDCSREGTEVKRKHLLDPRYFNDWWNRGSTKPLHRVRCIMELENMGVPTVFLSGLTANVPSEIYCLAVSCQCKLIKHIKVDF